MKKVLLVEDDVLMVRMYTKKLAKEGFQTEVATNGEEGLEKAKSFKPDIILLDIMMPKMSGTEMLEKLREQDETKDVPVIILTVLSLSDAEVKKCTDLGCKVLTKTSVTPQDVVDRIKSAIQS